MQSILPSNVQMKDFIYFFILLFIVTMLLLINPTYVNTFVHSLRRGQNWLWARFSRLLGHRRAERDIEEGGDYEDGDDEDDDGIEMDDLDDRDLRLQTGRGPPEEV